MPHCWWLAPCSLRCAPTLPASSTCAPSEGMKRAMLVISRRRWFVPPHDRRTHALLVLEDAFPIQRTTASLHHASLGVCGVSVSHSARRDLFRFAGMQVLPSVYLVTLVGTTHQQLHTNRLSRPMLSFLQGLVAVQLLLTATVQFAEPTAPRLLWHALALLVPTDVSRCASLLSAVNLHPAEAAVLSHVCKLHPADARHRVLGGANTAWYPFSARDPL